MSCFVYMKIVCGIELNYSMIQDFDANIVANKHHAGPQVITTLVKLVFPSNFGTVTKL